MGSRTEAGAIEKFGTTVDSVRRWGTMVWRLGALMAKGAYLIGERRRLFYQLGEATYQKVKSGALRDAELEPITHQLDRLTKKVELEEMLIRSVRFGSRTSRKASKSQSTGSTPEANQG